MIFLFFSDQGRRLAKKEEGKKAKKVGSFFLSLFYLKRLSVRNRKCEITNMPMTSPLYYSNATYTSRQHPLLL